MRYILLRTKVKFMLALTAYMDESGHSVDPALHHAGMAGFVAPASEWEKVEEQWQPILDSFGLKAGFHMKNFAHFSGEYKGWKEAERRELYGALIGVITKIGPVPTGSVVSVQAFNSLSDGQRAAFMDPYYLAFQMCTRGACLQAYGTTEKVAMVYAYQEEFGAIKPQEVYSVDQAGTAEKMWHWMKQTTDYGMWMGSYASSTPNELIPLQAADMLAYELIKEFENLLTRPNDKMRWGLRQMLPLANHRPLFSFFDRPELLRFVKECGMPWQEGVEEVADVNIQRFFARRRTAAWMERRINES